MRRGNMLESSGQMSVELAVVLPVLLVAMVIVLDSMAFMGECSRFDHVAAQAILAEGASADTEDSDVAARAEKVRTALAAQFDERGHGSMVHVETSDAGGIGTWRSVQFTCRLEMRAWPLNVGGAEIFGVRVPSLLEHSYTLAVEAYEPGRL